MRAQDAVCYVDYSWEHGSLCNKASGNIGYILERDVIRAWDISKYMEKRR